MSKQRLIQQRIRIEEMNVAECAQEHKSNSNEWLRRLESTNPPSSDEAVYHSRLQDILYLKSINEQQEIDTTVSE